jgi:uncharacterized protein YbjT (DUF2867 family)
MAEGEGGRVLVTGATGHQGGAVARHLLGRGGFEVRALTRDPAKAEARALADAGAEVVGGDLDDRGSLDRALEGVSAVFSVQNFWETGYEKEIEQGMRLADAAKAAGVGHFVYSSVGSAHRDTGLEHFDSKCRIEDHVRGTGLRYTILRPAFFMDNWESPMLRQTVESGSVMQPLSPDRPLQQIAADDIGFFAAEALAEPEGWAGRELDLAGDETTMPQVAAAFSRVLGRPVEYVQVPWDQYREAAGDEYYKMFRWFEDVGYEADVSALRRIHPALKDFDAYLKEGPWGA